jgi:lipopolysaccharide transport system permease protein
METMASAPPRPSAVSQIVELFGHRHLLAQFIRRELESQTRGSVLGVLWWVLNPLCMLVLYSVVFGMVMGGHFRGIEGTGPWDYPLGIFLGLSLLGLITESLNQGPFTIVGQPNLVHKVRFPTEILALAKVGASAIRLVISLALALFGVAVFGTGPHWGMLLAPVIVIPMLLMALGLVWILAVIGVYVRDSQQFMVVFSSFVFYTSAVFYTAASIPPQIMVYLQFNPVLQAVEEARNLLLWTHQPVDWGLVGYVWACGIGTCAFGFAFFRRLKHTFADVL